jgi:DNA-binding beta-propeller fold protein YncE
MITVFGILFLFASPSLIVSAIAPNKVTPTVFVENYGSNTVSAIVGTNVVATINVGTEPLAQLAYDNMTNTVWVTSAGVVSVIDASTFKVIQTIANFSSPVGALFVCGEIVALYRSCGVLVADFNTNTVYEINATTYKLISSMHVGKSPEFIGYSPVTKDAYVGNVNGHSISVIHGGKVITTIRLYNAAPRGITYDPVNKDIYVAIDNGHVYVINSHNKVVYSINGFSEPWNMVFNPTNKDMYVTDQLSGFVCLISSSNKIVGTIDGMASPTGIAYNPTNKVVYVADEDFGAVYPINGSILGKPIRVGSVPYGETVT